MKAALYACLALLYASMLLVAHCEATRSPYFPHSIGAFLALTVIATLLMIADHQPQGNQK